MSNNPATKTPLVLTAAELMELAGYAALRQKKGPAYCAKWVVGFRRRYLGPMRPENVVELHREAIAQADNLDRARALLAGHCRACGSCPMSGE